MLVVFDMDGVIVNSNAFWAHLATSWLLKYNKIAEIGLDEKINSYSIDEGIQYLNKHYDLNLTNKDLQDFIYDYYASKVELKQEIYQHIIELSNKKIPLVLLTSNDELIVNVVLERFNLKQYFCQIHANVSKHQLETYLAFKDQCILIDDSLYALQKAKEANWNVIGIYDPDSFEKEEEIHDITNIGWEDIIL